MNGGLEWGGFGRPVFLDRLPLCRNIPPGLRHWLLPIGLLTVATVLQAAGLQHVLAYNPAEIRAGQWWRLLTGNVVHLGWMHLLLDGAGLVLVWVLFGRRFQIWQWLVITAFRCWASAVGCICSILG